MMKRVKASARPKRSEIFAAGGLTTARIMAVATSTVDSKECLPKEDVAIAR
jgi:hypothetical protein